MEENTGREKEVWRKYIVIEIKNCDMDFYM